MSRVTTWTVNIKRDLRSLNCYSLAVPLPEMLREFPSARRNRFCEKVRQIVSLLDFPLGYTFRPGPRDPREMTEAIY